MCGFPDPNKIDQKAARQMAGGHKKVILLFAGTAWLRSCRFLFHQFVHGDKAHKVIGDSDALSALPAALVRRFDVDALDKLPQGVGGHFLQILVFVYPLAELLQIFNLSFLYFDFLLQGLDFLFKLRLLVLIGLLTSANRSSESFPATLSS